VRAYPLPEGNYLVTAYLPVGEPQQDADRRWFQRYRAHQLTRGGSYVPSAATTNPGQFQFRFDDEGPFARARGREVVQNGWQKSERRHRDPGQAGSTVEFALRKGPAYDLMIRVAPGAEKSGGTLTLTLNDKPLDPLKQDGVEPTRWRTSVPAAALKDGTQVLRITRGGSPVSVNEVELINPAYTVVDFLADAKRQNPSLEYRYQRIWEPPVAYLGWTVASMIVIGGIWPTLLAMLVGAGFGRAETEPKYDLGRFKGGKEEKKASKRQPTEAEQAKVRELADELEAKLLANARARGDVLPADAAATAEPVKTLVTAPLEIAADEKPPEQKAYAGDYYPVARGGKSAKPDDV
jgi:hypothetical protein